MIGTVDILIPKMLKLDREKKYELKEYREKRSLNANAYCWKLMSEIADVLNTSKEEIYEQMLQKYGTNLTDEEDNIIVISTVTELKSNESMHIAFMGNSYTNSKKFNHYRLIKGSSQYDTKEMSIFINGIVSDCKDLDIKTLDEIELEKLVKEWGI